MQIFQAVPFGVAEKIYLMDRIRELFERKHPELAFTTNLTHSLARIIRHRLTAERQASPFAGNGSVP